MKKLEKMKFTMLNFMPNNFTNLMSNNVVRHSISQLIPTMKQSVRTNRDRVYAQRPNITLTYSTCFLSLLFPSVSHINALRYHTKLLSADLLVSTSLYQSFDVGLIFLNMLKVSQRDGRW